MSTPEILKEAKCFAEAGFTIIRLNGKVPVVKNWTQAEYVWPDEVEKFLSGWNGNYGVVLSARDLVIDIDPRNFKEKDTHVRFFQDIGVKIKSFGAVAATGGGGIHIYLRLPNGVKIKESLPEYRGIEFKSRGRQMVGVGSIHPDTKKFYRWSPSNTIPITQIKEAPENLLRIIQRLELPSAPLNGTAQKVGIADEDEEVVAQFIEYLQTTEPAIEGANGDKTTFMVSCRGRDLGLSEQKTLDLMLEHFNARCIPEWTSSELQSKVQNAYSYASGNPGSSLPQSDFGKVGTDAKNKELFAGRADRYENGKLKRTLNNAVNLFVEKGSKLKDTLAYDEFNAQTRILKPLPWHHDPLPVGGLEWTDDDSKMLKWWFSREKEFHVGVELVDEAVLVVSKRKILHPVKDYLRGLQWDGVPRLETWLIDAANAQDNRFVREASKKFLLQAVSRIYHPGSKADHIIVLEGEQGCGKSTIVEILGGIWYADIMVDPHSRDTVDGMRGKWFLEFSEMVAPTKQDANAMKAFITRRVDRVRLAYGRRTVDLPRQCVFIGTINPDATNEYLLDDTGGRRWWPIRVGKVDFQKLQNMRDQLFAEAVQMVLQGEATHITDHDLLAMAKNEQKLRQTTDPWSDIIGEFVADKKLTFVTSKEIWVFVLKGAEAQFSNAHQRRIANCLKENGYISKVKRIGDKLHRGFEPVGYDQTEVDRQTGEMFN